MVIRQHPMWLEDRLAILRKNEVIIARRQVTIEEGDSVIVYINDKKSVSEIEKLFQPSAFFI